MKSQMSAEEVTKESIQIESMFDGRSHHGSFGEHLWYRWKTFMMLRRFACIGMLLMGAVFAMKTYGQGDKLANFVTISFILIGSIGYIRPMIWQMWSERKLRKHPAYGSQIEFCFSPDEVSMAGTSGVVNVPWKEFFEVVETKKGLLMYQNKKDYLWVPGYDFKAGEMAQVVSMHRVAK